MGYRRKSTTEGLLDLLYEVTDMSWRAGAVITVAIMILAIVAFFWVVDLIATSGVNPYLAPLISAYGWAAYLLPAAIWFLGYIYGSKTYEVYLRQSRY